MSTYVHADGGPTREGARFDDTLWGVYIRGVDEWYAATSRAEAENHANDLNTAILRNYAKRGRSRFDPVCWAVPDYWPFGPERHAHSLAQASEELKVRAAQKSEAGA